MSTLVLQPIFYLSFILLCSQCAVSDVAQGTENSPAIEEKLCAKSPDTGETTPSGTHTDPTTSAGDESDEDLKSNSIIGKSCHTNGGLAGESGLKTWCWEDVSIPNYRGRKSIGLIDNQLKIDSECSEDQVSVHHNNLRFFINPTEPKPGEWCDRDFNMRAEIRTAPWNIRHRKGTEEWFGWSYTFGKEYVIDQECQWSFFQVHPGITGLSPQIGLTIINKHQFKGHPAGEIYVGNHGNYPDYVPTGIVPEAGDRLDIVIHVVWGDSSNGSLKVWINGNFVYQKQVSTVYPEHPWGGNAKWGIYKWPWARKEKVQQSQDQGIRYLETFMGSLRVITRYPGDPDYGKNSYSLVAPR